MRRNSSKLQAPSSKQRKIILLAACSLQLATLLIGCAKREIKNIDAKGKNIICFGDSITFGYGVSAGEDYPSTLAKMLQHTLINAGIDGDTTTEALKRLESDVLDRSPRLVIIEFGGNDFLKGIPTETTINNIAEMVERIQEEGAIVAIADISAGFLLNQYHAPLYNLCKAEGAIFIPKILNGIITDPSLKSDFIHPNANGYKLIAERIYRVILPYLNQGISVLRENQ
ncbi:MAG: GDSL-type esterase/lipase family protein [Candidatus Omnitrophica bacterium]|nr:GDSL-type esterase/lipase family protein [Candidatus Omnitrophota bacterium]